ncbi:MAG: phosphoribosylglycinamide formyltransferase [Oscillospiraceae bacterium]|nr:phosphoribosylglycinamide formyltransferase [Oscillospiraceae bacterium]
MSNMGDKKIVVLVSSGGTNLQALIDAGWAGRNKSGKITCVISSSPDAFALKRAEKAGIKTRVLNRKLYDNSADYSKELLETLKDESPDLIVFAGFMVILEEDVCKAFKNRMLNVHPSLIPKFCGEGMYGLKVHEAVLKSGERQTGATVHLVTEVCDGGPVILQKTVEVHESDTPESLQKRVMEQAEQVILPLAVELFCNDKINIK